MLRKERKTNILEEKDQIASFSFKNNKKKGFLKAHKLLICEMALGPNTPKKEKFGNSL